MSALDASLPQPCMQFWRPFNWLRPLNQAAIERRKAAAFISGMHGGNPPPSPGKVRTGMLAAHACHAQLDLLQT